MTNSENHSVRAEIDSPIQGTRWALIDHGEQPGLLVRFDARLVPDVVAHLERLVALADPQLAKPIAHGVFGRQAWVIYAGTLEESLEELAGPLSATELLQLADGLMAALERAHEHGFVHPGITPSLVRMQSTFDGRVAPELLGLGLPSVGARTPHDDLADVAALLYRLYTGHDAFAPGAPRDGALPPSFAEVRPNGVPPPQLEAVIMRALGPRAAAYKSAHEMRAALPAPVTPRTRSSLRVQAGTNPHPPRAVRDSGISTPGQVVVPAILPIDDSERVVEPARPKRRPLWVALAVLLVGGVIAWLALRDTGETTREAVAVPKPPVASVTSTDHAVRPTPNVRAPAPEVVALAPEVVAPAPEVVAPAPEVVAPAPEVVAAEVVAQAAPEVVAEVAAEVVVQAVMLTLTSEPADCLVSVNGRERGRTPLELELVAADLPASITFARRGHVSLTKTIETLTGPAALDVKLKAVATRREPRPDDKPKPPSDSPILLGR